MSRWSTPATSVSPRGMDDAVSSSSPGDDCLWCGAPLPPSTSRGGRRWCSKVCRQAAWRARRLAVVECLGDAPKRLAYADPPFPGLARRYYGDQPSFAGEVDHRRLLEQLATYDGWALSTSRKALRDVLPLTPKAAVPCPWIKTHHHPPARGPANVHEYIVVVPARRRKPGVPDALYAGAARGGGNLVGRKPIRYVMWVFALLGASPRDTLDDLFPGTGIVGRCWSEFRRSAPSLTPAVDGGAP